MIKQNLVGWAASFALLTGCANQCFAQDDESAKSYPSSGVYKYEQKTDSTTAQICYNYSRGEDGVQHRSLSHLAITGPKGKSYSIHIYPSNNWVAYHTYIDRGKKDNLELPTPDEFGRRHTVRLTPRQQRFVNKATKAVAANNWNDLTQLMDEKLKSANNKLRFECGTVSSLKNTPK